MNIDEIDLPNFFNECQQLTTNDEIPEEAVVYALWNKQENKFYIGYTSNLKKRLDKYKSYKNNKRMQKQIEILKNWQPHYSIVIIYKNKNINELMEIEGKLLSKYKNSGKLYNKSFRKEWQPEITPKMIKDFESKLIKCEGECWIWNGSKSLGYGHFYIKGRSYGSHRISYLIYKGIYPGNLLVLHKCNNKLCCNPQHLVLGNDKENQEDYLKSIGGRKSKITDEKIKLIRKMLLEGKSLKEISRISGVGYSLIRAILKGKIKSLNQYLDLLQIPSKPKDERIIEWIEQQNDKFLIPLYMLYKYYCQKKEKICLAEFESIIQKKYEIYNRQDAQKIIHKYIRNKNE